VVVLDFGRIFQYKLTLDQCARNGALFGSSLRSYQETAWVQPYNDITSATLADGQTLNPPLTAGQVSTATGTGSDGNPNVTVTINYTFTPLTRFPGLQKTINLKSQTSMRVAP
jgi:hypothetical protein